MGSPGRRLESYVVDEIQGESTDIEQHRHEASQQGGYAIVRFVVEFKTN